MRTQASPRWATIWESPSTKRDVCARKRPPSRSGAHRNINAGRTPRPMAGMDSATATSASLTTMMTYDKNALAKMTVDLAQRAGAPVRPEELAKLPPMQMTDEGKYEFDRALGLMRKLTISRRVSVDKLERVDGWTITLVEAPKR